MTVVADLSIMPVGEGTSLSKYVKRAVEELKKAGLKVDVGAMSTSVEAETTEEIFKAFEKAKEALFEMGAKRVYMVIKIDERRDKHISIEYKKSAILK
ncbi:MAG: MTH1187 family thiamine-binding protein [Nitrososphaeria archaeon]|nr:MTH1187 family thiamine-binding protein [Nitrososphaeria archaeon]